MKLFFGETSINIPETQLVYDDTESSSGVIESIEAVDEGFEIVIYSPFHKITLTCSPKPDGLQVGDRINYKYKTC